MAEDLDLESDFKGLLVREGLCNLLEPYASKAGASASEPPEPGSFAACEQAWVQAWALPEDVSAAALKASDTV